MTSHFRTLLSYSGNVLNYFVFSADGENDEESKRVLKMLQTSVRYFQLLLFDHLQYIMPHYDRNAIGHFSSCLKRLFQSKAKCKVIDMKMFFYSHANSFS